MFLEIVTLRSASSNTSRPLSSFRSIHYHNRVLTISEYFHIVVNGLQNTKLQLSIFAVYQQSLPGLCRSFLQFKKMGQVGEVQSSSSSLAP